MKKLIFFVICFAISGVAHAERFEESGRSTESEHKACKAADEDANGHCPYRAERMGSYKVEWVDLPFVKGYWKCTATYRC
jgi:hypothetical protein